MSEKRKKLLYDISELSDKDKVITKFPELLRYKEFAAISKTDTIIRYIIFLYDHASDLVKAYPILKERKKAAIERSGMDLGKLSPIMKDLVNGHFDTERTKPTFDAIICFLKMQNSDIWFEICVLEQELEEYRELRLKTVKDDKDKDTIVAAEKKSKLRQECNAILKDLEGYRTEFYGINEDVQSEVQKIKITSPEQYGNL